MHLRKRHSLWPLRIIAAQDWPGAYVRGCDLCADLIPPFGVGLGHITAHKPPSPLLAFGPSYGRIPGAALDQQYRFTSCMPSGLKQTVPPAHGKNGDHERRPVHENNLFACQGRAALRRHWMLGTRVGGLHKRTRRYHW